jgi:hypothetical protein
MAGGQHIKRSDPFAPPGDAHVIRVKAIVRQLAGLQRELFELGYSTAGAGLAVVAEQIGRDVVDRLLGAGLFWLE